MKCAALLMTFLHSPGMKQNIPVAKIMTSNPLTVHRGDPISKIRKTFTESGVHHLPVTESERLVGILSWTDLMRISFGDAFGQSDVGVDATLDHTHKLEDIMNPEPVTIAADAPIREAARMLGDASFHALPVVENDKLVGIVTTQDLICYLRDLY